MFNKVILMGRLTRDPEFRQTQSGIPMCTFDIAIDRPFSSRNENVTDFFRIVTWRNNAEFASKYLQKGVMVIVDGRVQNDNYTDQQGVKHYNCNIVAENVRFGETRAAAESRGLSIRGGDSQSYDGNSGGYGSYGGGQGSYGGGQGNYGGSGEYTSRPPQDNAYQSRPAPKPDFPAPEPAVSKGSIEDFNEIMSDGDLPF